MSCEALRSPPSPFVWGDPAYAGWRRGRVVSVFASAEAVSDCGRGQCCGSYGASWSERKRVCFFAGARWGTSPLGSCPLDRIVWGTSLSYHTLSRVPVGVPCPVLCGLAFGVWSLLRGRVVFWSARACPGWPGRRPGRQALARAVSPRPHLLACPAGSVFTS